MRWGSQEQGWMWKQGCRVQGCVQPDTSISKSREAWLSTQKPVRPAHVLTCHPLLCDFELVLTLSVPLRPYSNSLAWKVARKRKLGERPGPGVC